VGCALAVEVENGKVIKVSGQKCPKGENYAQSEIENPLRILTATVLCQGLELKMLAVRTDQPIPKTKILSAMEEIRRIRVNNPVEAGDILVKNFLGLEVDLIATRDCRGLNS
jgi:CxxC motif-containing protein